MKFLLLIHTLLSSFILNAQFGSEMVVDTSIYGSSVSDIDIADMNNDGYQDLIIAHSGGLGRISVYLNDGIGAFGSESVISTNQYQNEAIGVGDFDLDGRKDIVSISKQGKITKYLQTTLGQYTQTDIFSGIFFPLDVLTTDLNQDGYMDFVSLGDRSILAFVNDGTGNFDTSDVASFTEYYSFCIGDINADGYPDLIAGSGRFFTFINDGNGSLVRDTTNESLLVPTQIHECELADMDGDSDLDVVVYYTNVYDKVDWYSNNGAGVLKKEGTITSMANNVYDINIEDIDLDNKLDLCLGYDQDNDLVWIKNLGNGNFSSETSINSSVLYPTQIEFGDFDNDGDMDFCHNSNDGLFYYMNSTNVLSINEGEKIDISWYPNPSNGTIFIETSSYSVIRIFDIHGTLVYHIQLPRGVQRIEPKLSNGNYILEIKSAKDIKRSKLIVLR